MTGDEKHSFAALEVDPRLALVLVDISAGSFDDVAAGPGRSSTSASASGRR